MLPFIVVGTLVYVLYLTGVFATTSGNAKKTTHQAIRAPRFARSPAAFVSPVLAATGPQIPREACWACEATGRL